MSDLIQVVASQEGDEERWSATLRLVAEWLAEYSGHSRATYADAIGWPYRPDGEPRDGDALRHGLTWLFWCVKRDVHPFDAKRIHVLAWIEEFTASRHPNTGEPLSKRSRAQLASAASSFYIWAMEEGHTVSNPVALINRKRKNLHASKDPSSTRSLSREETQAMIATADNDPVRSVRLRSSAIIALLFGVGPRVGEMCRATLADMRTTDGRRVLHASALSHPILGLCGREHQPARRGTDRYGTRIVNLERSPAYGVAAAFEPDEE